MNISLTYVSDHPSNDDKTQILGIGLDETDAVLSVSGACFTVTKDEHALICKSILSQLSIR